MSIAKKLVTVDDWLLLPSEERCELIEGEFVYKAMPSFEQNQGRIPASSGAGQARLNINWLEVNEA